MKRYLLFILTVALSVMLLMCFSACAGVEEEMFTVKFAPGEGAAEIPSQTVKAGELAVNPGDPVRDGYMFDGWYQGSMKWDFATMPITRNMTLKAKWVCYNITYNLSDGVNSPSNPATYTSNDEIKLCAPRKAGCMFIGWTYDGQKTPILDVTIPKGSKGDREYTAHYEYALIIENGVVLGFTEAAKPLVKEIEIPETYQGIKVTSIGVEAFRNCPVIESLILPGSVTEIGESAFFYCTSLKRVDIPSGTVRIEKGAFSGCSSIETVTLSDTVTYIGANAFSGCARLNSITVDEKSSTFKSLDGNLYTKDGKTIVQYASGKPDKSFTVPSEVTRIGNASFFYAVNLTSVTISQSGILTDIGADAFSGCSALASVNIPSSVRTIGSYAFFGCASLTGIDMPSSLVSIGDSAFSGCASLPSVNLPAGTVSIGAYAFSGCVKIESIVIPSSVTSIGAGMFAKCASLTNITVDANNALYKSIDGSVYTKDEKVLVQYAIGKSDALFTVPETVTEIGADSFEGCTSLTTVRFGGNSVSKIGSGAFEDCTALTGIIIPSSITEIGASAFTGCTSLTIYCEVAEKPAGWDYRWNTSDRPVVWGYNPTE